MIEATPNMMQDQGPQRPRAVDPTALPVVDAARLLSAAGGQQVTLEMLEADAAVGAALFVGGQEAKPVVTAAHPRGSRPAEADNSNWQSRLVRNLGPPSQRGLLHERSRLELPRRRLVNARRSLKDC